MGGFSPVFAFKEAKEQINFDSSTTFKNGKEKKIAQFRVTVKKIQGPAPSENATFRHEILELGSYSTTIWHHIECVAFYFSKLLHSAPL